MDLRLNNSCSFKSTIQVTDNLSDYYDVIKNDEQIIGMNKVAKGKNISVLGLAPCIGGGASNPKLKKCCIYHYFRPEKKELNDIYMNVKSLETIDEKPNIIITGGQYDWVLCKHYFQKLAEKLKEFKDNITIIWGQKDGGGTNVHYGAKDDIWTIYHSNNLQKNFKIDSFDDLKKCFNIIQIAPTDELFIKGKKVIL